MKKWHERITGLRAEIEGESYPGPGTPCGLVCGEDGGKVLLDVSFVELGNFVSLAIEIADLEDAGMEWLQVLFSRVGRGYNEAISRRDGLKAYGDLACNPNIEEVVGKAARIDPMFISITAAQIAAAREVIEAQGERPAVSGSEDGRVEIWYIDEQLAAEFLIAALRGELVRTLEGSGLPADAMIERIWHSPERRSFGLMLSHPSFEPAAPHGEVKVRGALRRSSAGFVRSSLLIAGGKIEAGDFVWFNEFNQVIALPKNLSN